MLVIVLFLFSHSAALPNPSKELLGGRKELLSDGRVSAEPVVLVKLQEILQNFVRSVGDGFVAVAADGKG